MVGPNWCGERLQSIAPVKTMFGWQKNGNGTSQIRKYLGLVKIKDKKAQTPESHAVDGIALAASQFTSFGVIPSQNIDLYAWRGRVTVTNSVFKVITRPNYGSRALHFDNPSKGGVRKRKGGTVTLFGVRYGDQVVAPKKGKAFIGWVGGFTNTAKTKNIAIYDHNWRPIGQFARSKANLIRRGNKLCVA